VLHTSSQENFEIDDVVVDNIGYFAMQVSFVLFVLFLFLADLYFDEIFLEEKSHEHFWFFDYFLNRIGSSIKK